MAGIAGDAAASRRLPTRFSTACDPWACVLRHVLDTEGRGAYFETDDYAAHATTLSDAKEGVTVRTNYT